MKTTKLLPYEIIFIYSTQRCVGYVMFDMNTGIVY